MQYLLLIYSNEKEMAALNPAERTSMTEEYTEFTKGIIQAGQFKAGDRLKPTSAATTVRVRNGQAVMTDGPFAETKELVAGFWLWQVRSIDEALEWVKRCPNPMPGDSEIEIRPVFEMEDFAVELPQNQWLKAGPA